MADDGGDWGDEKADTEKTLDSWMPLLAVFVAIGTFFVVLYFIFFAKASYEVADTTVQVVKHIASAEERAVSGTIDAARRERGSALRAARDVQRTASRDVGKQMVTELFTAAYNDFDTEKRDKIARRLVELEKAISGNRVERALFDSGAHTVLLEQKPTRNRVWYGAAVLHDAWDKIDALSVKDDHVRSTAAAYAFCVAGSYGKSLGVYKALIEGQQPLMARNTIANAVACGATSDKLGLELFEVPLLPVAGVAAARDLPEVEEQWSPKLRGGRTRLSVAARLYLTDKLSAEEFAREQRPGYPCWAGPWGGLAEQSPPQVLQEAADRLEKAKTKDKKAKAAVVENLRVMVVLQGLVRGEDLRGDLEPADWRNQVCMAAADYMLEPEAAVKRLQKLIGQFDKPKWQAHRQLALAYARVGDFENAFAEAQKLQELSRPKHASRSDANSLLIAFGHRTGRLDEVKLLGAHEFLRERLDLLQGSEEDRLAYLRRSENSRGLGGLAPASLYVLGALAPGHEEAFLDGVEINGSLAGYFWARAEAARWRGDADSEKRWLDRLQAGRERVADGKYGGYHMFWSRPY